jgi:peptidoglycan/LPS O-acetylase OafA/YrhL
MPTVDPSTSQPNAIDASLNRASASADSPLPDPLPPRDDAGVSPASRARDIASHHGIRGMAAFLVFVFHLQVILAWGGIDLVKVAPMLGRSGYLWVDCFFVLSGFILSYVYAAQFDPVHGRSASAAGAFWRARFARIYPLHAATLATLVLIRESASLAGLGRADVLYGKDTLPALVSNALLVQSWELHGRLTWNVPAWSISTEAAAYLLFPVLCRCVGRSQPCPGCCFSPSPGRDMHSCLHAGLRWTTRFTSGWCAACPASCSAHSSSTCGPG